MLDRIIQYSIHNKLIILLFTAAWVGIGLYSLNNLSIGAVPDITNNQVQVITTSRNLATEDVELFLTYPVELEMANLPGVKEIRSISKFGLSVVTIVFDEKMGTYLPRQLIAEKLKSAEEKIPQGFGTPFMGPISTGLGEIYQYILDVKPGYEDRYTVTELRTIQDWIVKRQLSGISGVVEINTWGGFLKTYEVAIEPQKLKALGITLADVFSVLQNNNSIAGGGYIEKSNESYFIRAEGRIHQLKDIEDIVVEVRQGAPIFIKDIAKVGFGAATRFGAITGNGQGEKVLGQVMMLKGASSKEVIDNVKEKVAEVQKILPEGVFINPFLERSELIGRTTFTIAENLILGSLIVIFVVILLLGNIRSGLIVASIIPLSLLFALFMMYIFNIDANLMSLGAIDFGIIIDGAVIIVEYIAFKVSKNAHLFSGLSVAERRKKMDEVSAQGSSKMMNAAIFGQIIIIIVFIPILTLSGVEGKMFQPMALTFSFALIGAMILCFTYIPVMSALFLKPQKNAEKNFSHQLVNGLLKLYIPTLKFALKFKYLTLSFAFLLLISALITFNRMGGEFIPTLDEGDFVIQPVLKTGMSLGKTVEMTTRMEKIIKKFPEVNQVVTRIGAAEVPTDPMSMEESDVIITLHPKKTWTSANSKDELADVLKEALEEEIPGIEIEFTQPIEMRFNELITGVRADLAIKIFGEDLNILYTKAIQIRNAIQNVEGAADIIVEKTEGLPQMTVEYNRQKIAQHGLNIEDLNNIIAMGFAGKSAGVILEGERQFDLVIRYDEANRKELDDIKNALVETPAGAQLPLSTFAEIRYNFGPAKISRDNTKRRIVVGVNVRGRDLQSVVTDVQSIIEKDVKIPPGYLVEYGGQFENLQSASRRLLIAVPIALVLIFMMLYFAFSSVRDALIIFSAIPLAAVGGVFLLYFRGMPFSISAGVGFIALFGIAVLNGIVLIEHFKELKVKGMNNPFDVIIKGTTERMRPVLLTASAAALGFLPMAISTSAGAEVQRPLATVVIGGLITATLLTLIVLPVLYYLLENISFQKMKGKNITTLLILILLMPGAVKINAQPPATLDEAIELAYKNNLSIKAGTLSLDKMNALIETAMDIPKSEFYYNHDRANLPENNIALHVFGVSQSIKLPSAYAARKDLLMADAKLSQEAMVIQKHMLAREISFAYNEISYWETVYNEYARLDSLYERFEKAASRKFELGNANYLEKITAEAKRKAIQLKMDQSFQSRAIARSNFNIWLQSEALPNLYIPDFEKISLKEIDYSNHPQLRFFSQQIVVAESEKVNVIQSELPEFNIAVFNGFSGIDQFVWAPGIQTGIAIPLWRKSYNASKSAASINIDQKSTELQYQKRLLEDRYIAQTAQLQKFENGIQQYESFGKSMESELIITAEKLFTGGEIDYFQYVQALESALEIKMNYLDHLYQYNQIVISLNYILN